MSNSVAYMLIAFVVGIFVGIIIGTAAHYEDVYHFEHTVKSNKAYYEKVISGLRTELNRLKHETEEKEHAGTNLHRDEYDPADWF